MIYFLIQIMIVFYTNKYKLTIGMFLSLGWQWYFYYPRIWKFWKNWVEADNDIYGKFFWLKNYFVSLYNKSENLKKKHIK